MLTMYCSSCKKLFQENILNTSEGIWENNLLFHCIPCSPAFIYMLYHFCVSRLIKRSYVICVTYYKISYYITKIQYHYEESGRWKTLSHLNYFSLSLAGGRTLLTCKIHPAKWLWKVCNYSHLYSKNSHSSDKILMQ